MKMNVRKFFITLFAVCLCAAGSFAQSNEKGIDYYRAELYGAAIQFFKQQSNQTPVQQAEGYYYLGLSYFATSKIDSATIFFKKAVETSPEYPYGYIGQGLLALKNKDAVGAKELFKKASGFGKKDPAVQTAIAEAFIESKMYADAQEALDRARKIDKKFPGIYVAEGDMVFAQGDVGSASSRYNNAILFDKNYKVSYLKAARVYKTVNRELALDYLTKLLAIDPDYIPAFAELGDIYYKMPNYNKAMEAYQRFIAIPGVPIEYRQKYAQLLYFTKKYGESLDEVAQVLAVHPDNFVMKRIQAYDNYELGRNTLGLEQMVKLMASAKPDELIYLDYIYYGRLLMKEKQPELAIENLKKAWSFDEAKKEPTLLKEIASSYYGMSKYPEAVEYYKQYLDADKNSAASDYHFYGLACYSSAVQLIAPAGNNFSPEKLAEDSVKRVSYLKLADEAFKTVCERLPDRYLGYLWRGNAAAQIDLASAKPYFEKALEIMLANNTDGKLNKEIIQAYSYLAGYSYNVANNPEEAKGYFMKVLELDPNNVMAKEFLDVYNKKKK